MNWHLPCCILGKEPRILTPGDDWQYTSPEIVKYSLWALTQVFGIDPDRLTYQTPFDRGGPIS